MYTNRRHISDMHLSGMYTSGVYFDMTIHCHVSAYILKGNIVGMYAYLGFARKYASLETEKERSRGVMPQKYGYVKK